jgi:hypothetical protein
MTFRAQCDQWNQAHAIGSPVTFGRMKYSTWTPAFITAWGSAVALAHGKAL